MADTDPQLERDGMRVLAAAYRLARGRTDITVSRQELWAEVVRERLLSLTDDEFEAYRARAVAEVRAIRFVEGRPDPMANSDSLGDRMKGYERATRLALPRRMPVILRVDGKGFHGVTRGCDRPFDDHLMALMNTTAIALCKEAQGAQFAFVQSDEISVLLHNYKRLQSEAWFDNDLQKLVSVSAGIAAGVFSREWSGPVAFDSRAFVLPQAEVCNYFIWRQQDATRNSIQMATRAVYSHREVNEKDTREMQEMLHAKGINWNDYPVGCKRGRAVVRHTFEREGVIRSTWVVEEPPIFTAERDYIDRHLALEAEGSDS